MTTYQLADDYVGMTYGAANGHLMRVEEVRWSEYEQRDVMVQWNASHADDCSCDGEPLEDW